MENIQIMGMSMGVSVVNAVYFMLVLYIANVVECNDYHV